MKNTIHNILTKIIKPFYWSGIWNYFPFNYIYKFHKKIWNSLYYTKWNEIKFKTKHWFNMFLKKWKFIDENIISFWEWEPNISNIIKNNLKKWNTFLDLWTNIWYFSILASNIVWENWKVISFEPSKIIFEEFNRNIELNSLKNIEKYNLWVWNENIKKDLFYNESNPWGTSLIDNHTSNIKETIEIIKLDDFLKNIKIDFIKMDIEWFEYFAIKWMINILKNNNLKMIFEYSPKFYEKLYWENHKKESISLLNDLFNIWFKLYEIDYKWNFKYIENIDLFYEKIYNWLLQIDIYCEK